MYQLPNEWEEFYNEMCKRAEEYIRIRYWSISLDDFKIWLCNFNTDKEKFLSALLIYKLIYRNSESILSMYHYIVEIILPDILNTLDIYTVTSLDDFHNNLKNKPWELPFKFSAIINIDNNGAKSSVQLLREFQRHGSFHKKMEVSFDGIANLNRDDIKAIVLIDDIVGSGDQFKTYLEKNKEYLKDFTIIYCPLVAHKDGLKNISSIHKNIILAPVEIIDKKYSFFQSNFLPKIAENINLLELEEFYSNLLKERTMLNKKDYLGKNSQALTYIFNVSTPNNVLPIFWYQDDNKWNSIVPR